MRTSCRELDRRSVADYQMTEGKQPSPGLGKRELGIVLFIFRHHRAAIGDMAEYAWVRPNLEMAKSDANRDSKEIHGEVGDPNWVKRESSP